VGDQIKNGLGQAWTLVATFFPKLLAFLLILFVGWLIAKAISKGLGMAMTKLGFGRLVEKTGLSHLTSRSGVNVATILVKLVYYFVLLIALQLAFGVFGESNPVSSLLNDVIGFLPRIVVAIVLVVVAAAIGKVVRDLITSAMGNRQLGRPMGTAAYVFIVAIGAIAALNQVNVATTVTTPILITVLATIGGVIVVGFGGGLVRPMQARWDGWINRVQHQLSATPPEPRQETAPGSAPRPVYAGVAQGMTQGQSGQARSATQPGHPNGQADGQGRDQVNQPQPPASDTPTPPTGFEQQRPQH
jgi:mechanosensitive ion channel-like protein